MGLSHSPFHVNGVLKWQGRSCSHPVYFALLIQNERHAVTGVCLNGQDLCILLEISARCVLSVMYPVADTFLQRRLVGGFNLFFPLFSKRMIWNHTGLFDNRDPYYDPLLYHNVSPLKEQLLGIPVPSGTHFQT